MQKVLPKSWHEEATCLVCKEETATGQVELSKPGNTVGLHVVIGQPWPTNEPSCISPGRDDRSVPDQRRGHHLHHDAAPPQDEADQSPCLGYPQYVGRGIVRSAGVGGRFICWELYLLVKPGLKLDQVLVKSLFDILPRIMNLTNGINRVLNAVQFYKQDEFRPWKTLNTLAPVYEQHFKLTGVLQNIWGCRIGLKTMRGSG